MFSKIISQIAAKSTNGLALFPVNPRKIALSKNYLIQGEQQIEHTTAFGIEGATAIKLLDVHTQDNSEDTVGVRCFTITETTHCSTTHTEGIGHIFKDQVTISEVTKGLESKLLRAALITVKPIECAEENAKMMHPHARKGDYVLTKESIENALKNIKKTFDKSINTLIVRCDHEQFLEKPYHQFKKPPYFSTGAMKYIVEDFEDVGNKTLEQTNKVKIKHIMTNLPSLDPKNDAGTLLCHVTFFGSKLNRYELLETTANNKRINPLKRTNTEMIYLPKEKEDGIYFVRLNVPANNLDHASSEPLLYDIQQSSLHYEELGKSFIGKPGC